MKAPVRIFADAPTLHRRAAERVVALAREAVAARGAFHLALAGGSTPRGLYQLLATAEFARQLPWASLHIYFGDERCVPPDHPESNYRMAREALLDHVPLPAGQIHPIPCEAEPQRAARDYADLLQRKLPRDDAGRPCFDLILLGLGPDGHIASLFPDTDILHRRRLPVAAVFVPKLESWRVSLTLPLLNNARHLLLLVSGAGKADVVRHVLDRIPEATPLPVERLRPRGEQTWMLDQAAARHLEQGPER